MGIHLETYTLTTHTEFKFPKCTCDFLSELQPPYPSVPPPHPYITSALGGVPGPIWTSYGVCVCDGESRRGEGKKEEAKSQIFAKQSGSFWKVFFYFAASLRDQLDPEKHTKTSLCKHARPKVIVSLSDTLLPLGFMPERFGEIPGCF